MMPFFFIDASVAAYQSLFEHFRFYVRLATIPFIVKMACLALVVLFGFDDNILRQGLFLLPSAFVDGWFVAHAVRYGLFKEIPLSLGGYDPERMTPEYMNEKSRSVLSAIVIYVLIFLLQTFLIGILFEIPAPATEPPQVPSAQDQNALIITLVALPLFAFFIWAFRFLWLYVPAALGVPLSDFIKKTSRFRYSLEFLAVYLMCVAPLMFVSLFILQFLHGLIPLEEDMTMETARNLKYIGIPLRAISELVPALVNSLGMAFLIKSYYQPEKKRD